MEKAKLGNSNKYCLSYNSLGIGDLALTASLVHSRKLPCRSLCLPSLMGRPKSQLTNEKFQGYDGTLNDARGAERLRVDFGDNP